MFPMTPYALISASVIRRQLLSLICLLCCCWFLAVPLKGNADIPPGAPAGTHILLYNPQGLGEDVTARYSSEDGHVYDFYGHPPILLVFNYTTCQVFDGSTGALIGCLLYPRD